MAFQLTVALLVIASLAFVSSRSTAKIVGGEEAQKHEFPYQISLQWNYNDSINEVMHFCGGSLLNENFVLTAAHCRTSYSENGFIEVVAAAHDVSVAEGFEQRRLVELFTIHEKFNGGEGVGPNDVAVISVDKPFELNGKVKTVQLPIQSEQFEGDVVLSGWGSLSTGFFPEYPDKLRKAVFPLVSYGTCLEMWEFDYALKSSNICTGPADGSKSACSADSGGPLVKLLGDKVVQVGIVSWGPIICGTPNKPGVFAGVSCYVDWIEKQLRK
ncbi:trypsin-1-like [Wyeomyia smithii]|uniref:trypsin-1-like n=1 Tax=Wyeomyia smithii TaxID=174621 RepID=UPI002467C0EE|nr:trypsin-1-like [Wyeomyia smithii]